MSRSGRLVAVLAAVAALAACGKVATDDSVEEQIKSQLGTDSSDCPTDLKGERGQSIVCKATKGGAAFDVKVTVTAVSGDTINFSIERVGGATTTTTTTTAPAATAGAPTVAGKFVAQSVLTQLAADGKQVDEVSCPDLPATVGASERCTLKSGADSYGVTVTVTGVQGTDVRFDIQVDRTPTTAPSR
ncbi:MAG: DUF4333 domain-containing protein [Pseudonocardia sp.]|nr:DUF4333 domain-containing protein [Pseudonocardia sp.]